MFFVILLLNKFEIMKPTLMLLMFFFVVFGAKAQNVKSRTNIDIKTVEFKTDTIFNVARIGQKLKFVFDSSANFNLMINEEKLISVLSDGKTGFGLTNPEYKVDVCGSIRASEELIVEANEWCDYVFDENYSQEEFSLRMESIHHNKHLPYILSESEILEEGIPVSETITGLLRNVEELYLYIEKLEQRITLLEKENENLKSE